MKEGMLWYDSHRNGSIEERIAAAIDFFESKYGFLPQMCYLNPKDMEESVVLNSKVKVIKNQKVLVNHIWMEFPVK